MLIVFGIALSHASVFSGWIDFLSFLVMLFAFASAWIFAVCENDIYDRKIDSISNPERPLTANTLSVIELRSIGLIFLLLALIAGYAVGHYVLFFVGLFTFIYHIYSAPPLRLKRIVFVNSFLVGLACLSTILAGFFFLNEDRSVTAIPFSLVSAIILFFTLVSNIRDIKDVEGDRADGVKTLPVLLGLERAKYLIAGFICFFFVAIPFYFAIPILYMPGILAAVLSWIFITAKQYKEWKAFVVYMAYLVVIIIALVWA